jgi:choline-glycine betaine transporter
MAPRIVLVIVLALVVGFGVSKVFEQEGTTQQAAQSGAQLDATLGNSQGSTSIPRWYDNASTIGLVAGGAVFVIGMVLVTSMRPKSS